MSSVQKGILPNITVLLSYLLPFGVLLLDLEYILGEIAASNQDQAPGSDGTGASTYLLLTVFTLIIPIYIGLLLASIFPAIEARRDGINFKYWGFFGSKVKWEEIDGILYFPNGYIVLRIERRGLPLFNGLYFNRIQARFVRSQLPILVLSPGLEGREALIEQIMKHGSPQIMKRAG